MLRDGGAFGQDPLLYFRGGGEEAFAVEGVPIGGHLGAVGVLDGNGIDGEENLGGFADGKIVAKGGFGDVLNLGGTIALFDALGVLGGFGDEPLVDFGFGNDLELGVLEVEAVGVAVLDDEAFLAAAIYPGVEDVVLDVEVFGEAVAVPGAAAGGEGVDDLKFVAGGVGGYAVGETVGLFPGVGVDDHFTVDEAPKDHPFAGFVVGADVFHIHEEVGYKLEAGLEENVLVVFEELFAMGLHNVLGGVADFKGLEGACGHVIVDFRSKTWYEIPGPKSAKADDGASEK